MKGGIRDTKITILSCFTCDKPAAHTFFKKHFNIQRVCRKVNEYEFIAICSDQSVGTILIDLVERRASRYCRNLSLWALFMGLE